MSKKIKLIRSIRNAADTDDVKEISMKDETEMSASDFYDVVLSSDGKIALGDMESAICNLCGLTSEQVASMSPKDYIMLSGEVGKYIA